MSAPQARAPLARSLQKLLAFGVGTLLALVLAEGGTRVWKWCAGEPYDGERAERELDDFVALLKGWNFVAQRDSDEQDDPSKIEAWLYPYAGFQASQSWLGVDPLREYFASEKAVETYDILLLGGSVAAAFSNWSRRALVPVLAEDPRLANRPIRVFSRACPAFKQPQLATDLEWCFGLGLRPDAVVALDGFNDIAVAYDNARIGVHPLFPWYYQMKASLTGPLPDPEQLELTLDIYEMRRSADRLAERARRYGLMRSAVLGGLVEREFKRLQTLTNARYAALKESFAKHRKLIPPFLRGPDFQNDPAYVEELSVRAWMEGSLSMQAACRARGIHFVHVLQPSARDAGSKPLTEEELAAVAKADDWGKPIEHGYPALRKAGEQLVREGVNFHDGSRMFADHPETIYQDMCHFDEVGCMILGRFIARALLDSWPKE